MREQQNRNKLHNDAPLEHLDVFCIGVGIGMMATPVIVPVALTAVGYSMTPSIKGVVQNIVFGSILSTIGRCVAIGSPFPVIVTAINGLTTGILGYIGSRLLRRQNRNINTIQQ